MVKGASNRKFVITGRVSTYNINRGDLGDGAGVEGLTKGGPETWFVTLRYPIRPVRCQRSSVVSWGLSTNHCGRSIGIVSASPLLIILDPNGLTFVSW